MTPPKARENVAILSNVNRSITHEPSEIGIVGRLDSNGNLEASATTGLEPGYVWVRLGAAGSTGHRAVVRAMTKRLYSPGTPVEVAINRRTRDLEIVGTPIREMVEQFGNAAAAVDAGLSGQYVGVFVKPNDIMDLQAVPDSQGGLWLRVTPGFYPGGFFPGGIILLVPTATSSKKALVCIGIDRDGTLVQELASDVGLAYTLTAADAAATIADNPDTTWLVGIGLHNGDTSISLAARTLVNLAPTKVGHVKNNLSATTAPGVGDDSADGYSIGSRWVNTSTDLSYVCVDSTAGAAVWQLDVLAIDDLTVDSAPDIDADYMVTYDTSASAHKKVLLSSVLAAQTRYNVYYNYRPNGGTQPRIGKGSSADGRTFTRDTEPLIALGTGGSFDDDHHAHPCVVRGPDGVLHLYFGGYDGSNYSVGLARSWDDGETWTKYGSAVLTGAAGPSWENSAVSWARVIYDEMEANSSKKWKMLYAGNASGTGGVGYAYSADGISWTKYASNPVLPLGSGGAWDDAAIIPNVFMRLGDTYYLFYNGLDSLVTTTYDVGLTTFTDPESTYTNAASPILSGDGVVSTLASAVTAGDTDIDVADSTGYVIGMTVWVHDADNWYMSRVVSRNDSTNTLTLADAAPANVATFAGYVRSISYNSVSIVSAQYDGGWRFWCTGFQPGFNSSEVMEASFQAYAADLDNIQIDYGAGLVLPITLAESDDTRVSFENPYVIDLWAESARLAHEATGGANTALSNLASVAINTSLVSDTDSTDNLGSTSVYWANGYIDTVYVSEQSAPSTPASGKVVVYAKTDGKLYAKDDAGTEYDLTASGGGGGSFTGDIMPMQCDGRLTLESGVAISTSDQTAKTTVYFTPYLGDKVALYDGANWDGYSFTERSLSLSGLTANLPHDIFLYDSAGTLTLEAVAWTNTTTRATGLTTVAGVYVKSGTNTKRYLGTICTTASTGQCEDSEDFRGVWNCYHRVPRKLKKTDTTNSWTYGTASWRSWNNSTANRVEVVIGLNEEPVYLLFAGLAGSSAAASSVGIALDSTSTNSADVTPFINALSGAALNGTSVYNAQVGIGYHYLQLVEYAAGGTVSFYGDAGVAYTQVGASGHVYA